MVTATSPYTITQRTNSNEISGGLNSCGKPFRSFHPIKSALYLRFLTVLNLESAIETFRSGHPNESETKTVHLGGTRSQF